MIARARRRIDVGVVAAEHPVEELGQRTGHLDAGRPGAGDHEREQTIVDQRGLDGRLLEASQHVVPQRVRVIQRVERETELLRPRDAEVVRGRAHREHERVVGDRVLAVDVHDLGVRVDADDLPHPALDVRSVAHDGAHRVRDVAAVEPCSRDLVEQRLERVVVALVDHHDVDRLVGQQLDDVEAREAHADHDHPMATCPRRPGEIDHRLDLTRRRRRPCRARVPRRGTRGQRAPRPARTCDRCGWRSRPRRTARPAAESRRGPAARRAPPTGGW